MSNLVLGNWILTKRRKPPEGIEVLGLVWSRGWLRYSYRICKLLHSVKGRDVWQINLKSGPDISPPKYWVQLEAMPTYASDKPIPLCEHGALPDECCPECLGIASDNPDDWHAEHA